jgi:hypothetical protein
LRDHLNDKKDSLGTALFYFIIQSPIIGCAQSDTYFPRIEFFSNTSKTFSKVRGQIYQEKFSLLIALPICFSLCKECLIFLILTEQKKCSLP